MSITIDFSDTISKAQKIKEASREISRIADKDVRDDISILKSGWKCDSGTKFCQKITRKTDSIAGKAAEIYSYASTIENKAKRLQEIEKIGVSIFS